MSTGNEIAGISVQIEMEDMLAELKRLGPGMDAAGKDMVAALARQMKRTEAAHRQSTSKRIKDEERAADAIKRTKAAQAAYNDEIAKLDPELRGLIESHKAQTEELERQAAALGLSTNELLRLQGAAGGAAKGAEEGAEKTEDLGAAAGAAGGAAGKLTGVLGLLGPGASEAAGGVNDMADAAEVAAELAALLGVSTGALVVTLGALATAVGVGYVAWRAYSEEGDRADRVAGHLQEAMGELTPILNSTRDATIDLKERTGELSEEQAALARNSIRAFEALQQATESTRVKQGELRKEQGSLLTQYVDMGDQVYKSLGLAWTPMSAAFDGLTTTTGELQEEIDGLGAALTVANEAAREDVRVTSEIIAADLASADGKGALTDSTQRYEEALQRQAEALRETLAIMAEEGRLTAEVMAGIEALQAVARTASDARLKGEAKAQAALDRSLEQLQDQYQAVVRLATTDDERLSALAAYQVARVELEETTQAEIDTIRDQAAEREIASLRMVAEERARIAQAQLSSAGDLFSGLADLAMLSAESQADTNAQGARRMAKTAKALATVQALLNAASGISIAASSAAPPYNIIPIAAATVQGTANVGAVAATPIPTFNDTPRAMKFPQRQVISVGSGDHVIAARDPQEVKRQADALAGNETSGGRRAHYTVAPSGRVFGETIHDSVKVDSPLRRELRAQAAGTPGFRS